MELKYLGWDDCFATDFDKLNKYNKRNYLPARVASCSGAVYRIYCADGEQMARLAGSYTGMDGELPVVGDWVATERKGSDYVIRVLLPRRTWFARKPAISGGRKMKHGVVDGGATVAQVLAANVDVVFMLSGMDDGISRARTQRYLAVAAAGGVAPVLLLNKADLCPPEEAALRVEELRAFAKCPVLVTSTATGMGLDAVHDYLQPGVTVAFLGPSGVGKSTMVNALFGEGLLQTGAVNAVTGKGRHTTTRAELLLHASGGMLIDTPGIRELQLWCDADALEESFADVAELTAQCRFSDCGHSTEPGCAVRAALADGTLEAARYENYRKLHAEVARLEGRRKQRAQMLGRRPGQRG